MKKFLALMPLLFIAFVATAWSITWLAEAHAVKAEVIARMEQFDPVLGSLKADSVDVGGFPFAMTVKVTNPSVSLNVKTSMTALHKRVMANAGNSAGVLATPEYNSGTLDYKLTGLVTLSLNALSDRLALTIEGNNTTKLTGDNYTLNQATEYDGPRSCEITLKRGLGSAANRLWHFEQFIDPDQMGQELRSIGCDMPGSTTTDSTTNQLLFSLGHGRILVSNNPAPGRANMAVNMEIKDMEWLPEGDAAYAHFMAALQPKGALAAPTPSIYGKQSLLLDMTADVPVDKNQLDSTAMKIDITRINLTNAAQKMHAEFHFQSAPKGDEQQFTAASMLTLDTTPKQSDVAKALVPGMLANLSANPDAARFMQAYDPEKLKEAVFEALPNATALGTITQKLSLSYSGNKAKTHGKLQVSDFELSTRDNGLTGTGDVTLAEGQQLPVTNANITCKNCLAMVDMMAGYLQRVDGALASLSPQDAGRIALTPEQLAGIKSMLTAVGTPAASAPADLQFVVANNANGMQVNGKSMAELAALAQQYLPKEMPAAPAAK